MSYYVHCCNSLSPSSLKTVFMVNTGDEGIKNKFFSDLKCLLPVKPEGDDHLVRGFQNVGLGSGKSDISSEDMNELSSDAHNSISKSNFIHPIIPDAEDCLFFVRTGTCKFGLTCKFNHPKIMSPIPCKFYQTGLCKYGESCRFNHSISEADKSPLQFNFLGYPKRWGKISCSFYMRTGICDYGTACRFHHPDPVYVLEPELYGSALIGEPMKEDSESTQSYPSLPRGSLQYVYQTRVLSGYQASEYNQEAEMVGSCSTKREPCVLNDVGLPIRLGKKECWNYQKLGVCKLGRACAYDHPKKKTSTYGSTSDSVSGVN